MNKGLIGIQMSTIKSKINKVGIYETLKGCAELGYHYLEVSQIPMTPENLAEIKEACSDFGMKVVACSAALSPKIEGAPGEFLVSDFDKIVADCRALNCNIIRMGMIPMTYLGSYKKALEFAYCADEIAEKLKNLGIDLYYHNHHLEFIKYNGEYLLDIIKNNTKYLGFELDTHWIHRGGEDPVAFIKKYNGRIRLLHLKDYRIGEIKLPDNPLDSEKFMMALADIIEFAEIGEGYLPMKECIEAGLAGGSEYFLIEQDFTYERDVFESLRISRNNLIKMGYEDWF